MASAGTAPLKPIGLRMTRLASATFFLKIFMPTGARQPLTNWTLTFEASPSLDDDPADIIYTIGSGLTVTDEAEGEVTLQFVPGDTAIYPNTDTVLRFELTGTSPAYPSTVLLKGTLTIEPTFT